MPETNDNLNAYRLRELTTGLDRLAALARQIVVGPHLPPESPEYAQELIGVWTYAPLKLRLKFVMDLLSEECELQPALRQALALEELRASGLQDWITQYPGPFADAVQQVSQGIQFGDELEDPDQLITLTMHVLQEAWGTVELEIASFDMEWISAAQGAVIAPEFEVVGELSSSAPKGRVALVNRQGLRQRGKVILPAQVLRSAGPGQPAQDDQPSTGMVTKATDAMVERSSDLSEPDVESFQAKEQPAEQVLARTTLEPDWMRILRQRTHGSNVAAVSKLLEHLQALVDIQRRSFVSSADDAVREEVCSLLQPLLPLLSLRYADGLSNVPAMWGEPLLESRDAILEWLSETLSIELINPARADRFDSMTMQSVETRRTVHSVEDETVARVERIGVSWYGKALIRAQVVKYATGSE